MVEDYEFHTEINELKSRIESLEYKVEDLQRDILNRQEEPIADLTQPTPDLTQLTPKLNRKIKPLATKKPKPVAKVPEDVQKIINFWNSLGLRQHSNPNAKIYLEIVKMLKKLMNAKFFESTSPYAKYAGTEFTPKQIMDSIHQFSFAALNFNYKPQGSFKETLKKTSLQDFLYNNRIDKSFFIEYHENEAKLLAESDKMVDDPDPEQTMILKDVWVKQILKDIAPNSWSTFQERDFRKCSKEIGVWFGNNGKKIGNYWNVNGDTVMHKRKRAELLMSCLLSSVNEDVTKLTVSHLAYPSTFNEKFPKYLNQQGVLE